MQKLDLFTELAFTTSWYAPLGASKPARGSRELDLCMQVQDVGPLCRTASNVWINLSGFPIS